jgi:hypothetical protein
VGAVVTAILAGLAFRKQSQEVRLLQREATDQQELTRQQGDLLAIQSGQLETQRQQLADQQAVSAKQVEVLELQASDLRASLDERARQVEFEHQAQASQVAAWFADNGRDMSRIQGPVMWGARIRNASDLPIYSLRVFFHAVSAVHAASEDFTLVDLGGPPERIRTIEPRSEQFVTVPGNINLPQNPDSGSCAVSVEFVDASRNRWQRDGYGALHYLGHLA